VRAKVVSAAIYPLILLCVGGAVNAFLVGYVVPRFAEVYQGAGRSLPWMSQLVLDWGRFAARHDGALAAVVAGLALAAFTATRRLVRRGGVGGRPLSGAFEANNLATPISLRMLRVGERTGDMGAMLMRSAAFYDGEIGRWIDRFTRTFEPLLMAAIGLVVGAIVILLYMPIFDLAGDMP
jgi:general secretion pathway protein F